MKRLFLVFLAFGVLRLYSFAQVDHDYDPNEMVPIITATIPVNEVPASVVKAVNTDFVLAKPETWNKFPYALQEYGWVYDKGAEDVKPDHYEVNMVTQKGNQLSAIYANTGILIETKEELKNAPIPASVQNSLANSKYKDWKVVGNSEIIRYFHDENSVEQHFRLTVEKDNVQRTISFNYQASY